MTKRFLLLILALSGVAFGQMTFQQCVDNANAQLNTCIAAAQTTYDIRRPSTWRTTTIASTPIHLVRQALPGATGPAALRTILASIIATSSSSGMGRARI
jgi:hypothetical protein